MLKDVFFVSHLFSRGSNLRTVMKTLEVLRSSPLCHHVASGHCGQSFEIDFNLKQRPLPPTQEVEGVNRIFE